MKMVAISRFRSRYFVVVNFVRGKFKMSSTLLTDFEQNSTLREKSLPLTLEVEYNLTKVQKQAEIHNPPLNEFGKVSLRINFAAQFRSHAFS